MNSKLFTGLALAAALLIGEPAFAKDHRGGGGAKGGHAVAAVHRGGSGARVASSSRAGGSRGARVASGRSFSGRSGIASTRGAGRSFRSKPGVAFGGNSNNGSGRRFAFRSHEGWDHGRTYFWNGRHYRWYDDAWFIIDPYPYYDEGSASVGVQVQQDLANDGYYQGPIDGVIGPGTRAAIAAFQRDNGLAVTGTITPGLLNLLGIG